MAENLIGTALFAYRGIILHHNLDVQIMKTKRPCELLSTDSVFFMSVRWG